MSYIDVHCKFTSKVEQESGRLCVKLNPGDPATAWKKVKPENVIQCADRQSEALSFYMRMTYGLAALIPLLSSMPAPDAGTRARSHQPSPWPRRGERRSTRPPRGSLEEMHPALRIGIVVEPHAYMHTKENKP